MVIRHLPFFIVAAEEEHFDRAASRLHIAQPALSRRIKAMEEELDVVLFERLPRGVRLSPAGQQLYKDTHHLLRSFQLATERLQRVSQGVEGRLSIGLTEIVIRTPIILRLIRRFRAKHPSIEIDIKKLNGRRQLELLASGELNVGFFYQAPTDPQELSYKDVSLHSYSLVLPRDHRLTARKKIYLKDLVDEKFAWIPRIDRPSTYDQLMSACLAKGLSPKIAYDAQGGDDILSYASHGLAIGFVNTERLRTLNDKTVVIRQIADLNARLQFRMAWRTSDQSGALKRFIALAHR